MRQTQDIIEIIDHLLESLEPVETSSVPLKVWLERTVRFLSGIILPDEISSIRELNQGTLSFATDKSRYREFLLELKRGIQRFPALYLVSDVIAEQTNEEIPPRMSTVRVKSNKVFIVHGHADLEKLAIARTVERLGLEAIILHEQSNQGRAIIEKFEDNASTVGFAVILMTADDVGYARDHADKPQPRARQNVVLELGYFLGLLGRNRVCVLYKGDVEIPSDYLGVVYTPFDEVGAWRLQLAKEMKLAGLGVDLNRL